MRRLLPFLLLLLLPSFVRAGELKAGAFAQDITPEKFPVSVNGGFADRERYAEWFAMRYGYLASGGRATRMLRQRIVPRHAAK